MEGMEGMEPKEKNKKRAPKRFFATLGWVVWEKGEGCVEVK